MTSAMRNAIAALFVLGVGNLLATLIGNTMLKYRLDCYHAEDVKARMADHEDYIQNLKKALDVATAKPKPLLSWSDREEQLFRKTNKLELR